MQNTRWSLDRNVTDFGRLEEFGHHEIQAETKYLMIIIIIIIIIIIMIIVANFWEKAFVACCSKLYPKNFYFISLCDLLLDASLDMMTLFPRAFFCIMHDIAIFSKII